MRGFIMGFYRRCYQGFCRGCNQGFYQGFYKGLVLQRVGVELGFRFKVDGQCAKLDDRERTLVRQLGFDSYNWQKQRVR